MEQIKSDFRNLEIVLKKNIKKEPVYYVPNPGNWGDGLIREGTVKFFRDIGLDYEEILPSKKQWFHWMAPLISGATVIFGGGGGWCRDWNFGARYVNLLRKRFQVIVLPSTYEQRFDYPNTLFFCRDKIESKKYMPNAFFCHDMAFYLGRVELKTGSGTGYFFRRDKESSGEIKIPEENVDISAMGDYRSEGITFFKNLANYSVIHTDRLHVAISSCLLGLELHFYPGSYFKNYSVYQSSMKNNFENVHFHQNQKDSELMNRKLVES